jgi:hypothetical protein
MILLGKFIKTLDAEKVNKVLPSCTAAIEVARARFLAFPMGPDS